ncbi:transglycosylase domain-containing protein [Pseudahrensia aquimaris]|uniref:peptidoglycan glycosyltransferase n=1 Tax=Pseudahrensia aquimaris TaxID=744461 RepID=A0ABW3FKZ4_9HYPH
MAWRKRPKDAKRIEPTMSGGRGPAPEIAVPGKKKHAKQAKGKGSLPWRFTKWATYWSVVLGLWGFIAVLGIFAWYGSKLPSAATWEVPERPPNVRIVADDGAFILNRGVGGDVLRIEDMSPWLPQAVIAIEDHRYQYHFGFDPIGFTRAMVRNVASGRMREGGSTITQQLAKNLFLKPERTFERKIQELIISFWLEAKFSKSQILELYLNRVYFGAGAWGVDSAARRYFGKSANVVSLQEAAMLAGLLKAPSRYSPATNPDVAKSRAQVVLNAMVREGYVEPDAVREDGTPVITTKYYRSGPEHFAADMIMKRVTALVGEIDKDVTVETTLSPFMMTAAHAEVGQALAKHGKKKGVSQAALVTLSPDGAIRALIGGRNYGESQFNRATDAKRQPGSAFKTFVWQAALERGYIPASIFTDEPVSIGNWSPENYDRRYRGDVRLDDAFAQSLNTIAVKMVRDTGSKAVAQIANRMGIGSKLTHNASIALGTSEVSLLEMTAAYAPYANGGFEAQPYIITKITDADGKVLYSRGKRPKTPVINSGVLGNMNAMLHKVVTQGTGKSARVEGHHVGGKTGTSQNFRDAWFVGHTAHFVTGVWFGNDDNSPTKKLTGGSLPAQVFSAVMGAAHHGLEEKLLPGDGYLLATLPTNLPTPDFRPWQEGEPRPSFIERVMNGGNSDNTVVATVPEPKKRTILDILFGD